MKKIMAVLTVLMCFASTNAFAQLKEVRGVQTRMIKYDSSNSYYDFYGDKHWSNSLHGYEFKNENNYAVWVEAELCTHGFTHFNGRSYDIHEGTRDTKSFTLNAGETYIWKCGNRMLWGDEDISGKFYVKYKAYKAE